MLAFEFLLVIYISKLSWHFVPSVRSLFIYLFVFILQEERIWVVYSNTSTHFSLSVKLSPVHRQHFTKARLLDVSINASSVQGRQDNGFISETDELLFKSRHSVECLKPRQLTCIWQLSHSSQFLVTNKQEHQAAVSEFTLQLSGKVELALCKIINHAAFWLVHYDLSCFET